MVLSSLESRLINLKKMGAKIWVTSPISSEVGLKLVFRCGLNCII